MPNPTPGPALDKIQVWDVHKCPRCGGEAPMGLMSLVARCTCGMFFADVAAARGWYASDEDYMAGRTWEEREGK